MAQSSKILYLITQSEWGGAQRYIFDLATNLKNKGYEVRVAAGGKEELHTKLDEKKVNCYKLKNLVREIKPIKDLKAYFEIKKLLKETKPDILHLNSSKAGIIGAIAGRHMGIKKIIYTVHGFVFNEPLPTWKKMVYLLAEQKSAKYKDKLICVSEFDRQTGIKNRIAEEKLITINNGIGSIKFLEQKEARNKLNLADDKIIIGTIANFYHTKGLEYLIQAAKTVVEQFPNIIFVIFGEGKIRKRLEAKIESFKLNNNFILTGKIDRAFAYLPVFDIYVCSSIKEGFPYSILEAMQAGLPIIATEVGGIPEMIKNESSGLIVKPADPAAMAKAIINILENKNLATKLGSQAKIDVMKKFNLDKMVEETEKIYHQL